LRYLFEDYSFDTDRRELHRGDGVIPLAPQVFDLLNYLICNRERVVSKEELSDAIWKGRVVTDGALTTRLRVTRSAIGDSGEDQRLIKTLPRKGWRFVGLVREAPGPTVGALAAGSPIEPSKPGFALPDKPSIAVLPFQNMSGDVEQEYFADGMVDEIITALSRFNSLFVIARNSSFFYKGKAVDIKQIGRELGVRYVLEGSVRKAGEKVRIIGQLIDATTGMHLWADQFEGDLRDIFALQDRMTESVVSTIAPKMLQVEVDLALGRPNSLNAYDLCLRALPHFISLTRSGTAEALRLASRALEIEPRYGSAARLVGSCHFVNVFQMWAIDPKSEIAEGFRLIRLALSINGNDDAALGVLALATAFISDDEATARQMVDRAVALNPNAFLGWYYRGCCLIDRQPEEAIRSFERCVRISPFDRSLVLTFTGMGFAFIHLGRFDEAIIAAKNAIHRNQSYAPAHRCLAAALTYLGRDAEARIVVKHVLEIEPDFRLSKLPARHLRDPIVIDAFRKAGFPE
jgi:TolB-like protein/tetratricopeptide (TPR) repeat protein